MTDLTWFDEKMHKFSYILTSPWPSARQADALPAELNVQIRDGGCIPAGCKFLLGLAAAQILTGTGVDLDALTLLDKDRNLNNSTGLNGSGLEYVSSSVALTPGSVSVISSSTNSGGSTAKTLPL